MTPLDIRRSAWEVLDDAQRAALSTRPFTRAEATAFEGHRRAEMLVLAVRLAAPDEPVRLRACAELASRWRNYVATRWDRIDRFATPPTQVERLEEALHWLSRWWNGRALEADTIARLIRDRF